jgi:hypothetical protein
MFKIAPPQRFGIRQANNNNDAAKARAEEEEAKAEEQRERTEAALKKHVGENGDEFRPCGDYGRGGQRS